MGSRGIVQSGSVIRNFTDRKFWATAGMQSILSPSMLYCRRETHHRGKIASQFVVLDQISLIRKVYRKYRKQTRPLGYLDHIMALNGGRHDFTKDPGGSQKHCFL